MVFNWSFKHSTNQLEFASQSRLILRRRRNSKIFNYFIFIVEKVAHYESVHQIRTLNDLKSRLSASRRCFIYTHSTMPYEPLVILHIALTKSISSNIHDVLKSVSTDNELINEYTNAIFYSINSCQKGLQQVDLGNALIKSCVRLLIEQIPSLRNFHTLSPIPKFREWLDLKISTYSTATESECKNKEYFNLQQTLTPTETALLLDHFKLSNKNQLFIHIRQVRNSKAVFNIKAIHILIARGC